MASEFTIKDTTLVAYTGKESHVIVPGGVTIIGPSAFAGNPFVKSITLPEGVRVISKRAFYYCTSLREIVLPQSVETIGEEAFRLCRMLKTIELPSDLSSVRELAFSGCMLLTNVRLPASIAFFGTQVFFGCKRLEVVTLADKEIPFALLNTRFEPPFAEDAAFPAKTKEKQKNAMPPELFVAWRAWLVACGRCEELDAESSGYLYDQGAKVFAALGYHPETVKYIAKQKLIPKSVALQAAAECSGRGYVEACALLMECAQGFDVQDELDL